jgi:transcriptional regulator with XRE-family HTH domain
MKTKVNQKVQQKFLKEFGKHLKELRKKQNMTQAALAEKCISDISKICNTEQGKYDFRISSLLIIANGLNVTIEELISFSGINILKNIILQNTGI